MYTLGPLLDEFERWVVQYGPQVSPQTARRYRAACEEFADRFGHPIHADVGILRQWFTAISEDAAPNTINRKIASLRALYSFLRDKGACKHDHDPMQGIQMRAVQKRLPQPVAHDDMRKIIAQLKGGTTQEIQDAVIIEVLYGSGLRRDELARLRLCNLIDRDTIRVVGKGDKERVTIITDPAYDAIKRLILRKYGDGVPRTERIREEFGDDTAMWDIVKGMPEAPLLHNAKAVPLAELKDPGHYVYDRWRSYAEPLEIKASPHKVRHAFATRLRSGNVDLVTIQELLGHEDIRTTQMYAALEAPGLRAAKAAHARQRDT
jgi:site-specific recombinase XerD